MQAPSAARILDSVDSLKELTKSAEKMLDDLDRIAPVPENKSFYKYSMNTIREALDMAGRLQSDLSFWRAEGRGVPRKYNTWLTRYVAAEQDWYRRVTDPPNWTKRR
jgi:hypothetical protein